MVVLTSFAPPGEGIRHQQANTHAHVQGKDLGVGTLYISESRVSWMAIAGQGFSLEYPAISLHAVSRDLTAFPHECLYLMVDGNLDEQEGKDGNSSAEEDSDSSSNVTDVRFIPEDKEILDQMFQAMSDCQSLHPDPEDSFSDEEFYTGEEGEECLTEDGQARLQQLENIFEAGDSVQVGARPVNGTQPESMETGDEPMETGQFEDAEHAE